MSYNVIQFDNDNQKCWFAGLFAFLFAISYLTQYMYLVHVWSAMCTRIQTDNTQCSRIVTSVAFKVSYDRPVPWHSFLMKLSLTFWTTSVNGNCMLDAQIANNYTKILTTYQNRKLFFLFKTCTCISFIMYSFCCSTNNDDFKMCFQRVHIEDIEFLDVWNLCYQWQGYFLHIFMSVKHMYMHIKNL